MRFLLSDPEAGREILERAGLAIVESDLIGVELPDSPQPMLQICTALLAAEVNITQIYPLLVASDRPAGRGADGRQHRDGRRDAPQQGLPRDQRRRAEGNVTHGSAKVRASESTSRRSQAPPLHSALVDFSARRADTENHAHQVTCPGCLTQVHRRRQICRPEGAVPEVQDDHHDSQARGSGRHPRAGALEAGAVGAGGRHVLKTYKRKDTKFQPLVFAGVIGVVLVVLLVALVLRGQDKPNVAAGAGGDRARAAAGLGRLHVSCATRSWKAIRA